MSTIEPIIKIARTAGKLTSIAVVMPVKSEWSFDGYLKIHIPLFDSISWAKDETGIEKAVETDIILFCKVAEKHGRGIEKELQSLGWVIVDESSTELVLKYNINKADHARRQILRTGQNHINKRLQLT